MSFGWNVYVIGLIAINIAGCAWLLYSNRNVQIDPREKGQGTGHDFDGIEELNNPLPAWWTWLFVVTIVFSLGYLLLYPGLGSFVWLPRLDFGQPTRGGGRTRGCSLWPHLRRVLREAHPRTRVGRARPGHGRANLREQLRDLSRLRRTRLGAASRT